MIVHAEVRDVRGHPFNCVAPPDLQKPRVAGGVELEQRRTVLKPLRPFRPSARRVSALHCENRRAVFGFPAFLEAHNFWRGELEQPLDFRDELLRGEPVVDFHCVR